MITRILTGDALKTLRTLPAASCDCCVTSPPYWGLRCYGTTPATWDGDPGCRHVWGLQERGRRKDVLPSETSRAGRLGTHARQTGQNDGGRFCVVCGAWRGELGLEPAPELYARHLVAIFGEVRRVLKPSGTLWLVIGDSYTSGNRKRYDVHARHRPQDDAIHPLAGKPRPETPAGLKQKDLVGIPWRVAFALQAAEWYLRADIIWSKPNCLPSSVRDRPTITHEHIFLLAASRRYYYDQDAIREPHGFNRWSDRRGQDASVVAGQYEGKVGRSSFLRAGKIRPFPHPGGRNKRSVWTVPTRPGVVKHFATYPVELVEPCVLAGCPPGGVVLDPFAGTGTTGAAAEKHGRGYILIELNPEYAAAARARLGTQWKRVAA